MEFAPSFEKSPICYWLKETQNENRSGWHCVSQLLLQTRNANYSGQRELAETNSKTALNLNHAALGIGLIVIVLLIIVQIVFWVDKSL